MEQEKNRGYMPPSQTDVWTTPKETFDALNAEFDFSIDAACSSNEDSLCRAYYTEYQDALKQDWKEYADLLQKHGIEGSGAIFVNPPYSELAKWIAKARKESDKGATVVMLIPARTDTKAFHEHIFGRAEVRFIKGRLKFGGNKNAAPFASCIVIFRPKDSTK